MFGVFLRFSGPQKTTVKPQTNFRKAIRKPYGPSAAKFFPIPFTIGRLLVSTKNTMKLPTAHRSLTIAMANSHGGYWPKLQEDWTAHRSAHEAHILQNLGLTGSRPLGCHIVGLITDSKSEIRRWIRGGGWGNLKIEGSNPELVGGWRQIDSRRRGSADSERWPGDCGADDVDRSTLEF